MSVSICAVAMVTLLLAPPATGGLPSICVQSEAAGTEAGAGIPIEDLVAALRARLERREIPVETCGSRAGVRPTWRVLVRWQDADTVVLDIRGARLALEESIAVGGLGKHEVTQLVALAAAEALRPSLDKLLAELGFRVPPERDADRAVEAVESAAVREDKRCPAPSCPEQVDVSSGVDLGVAAGPLVTVEGADLSFFGQLWSGLRAGPVRVAVHAGFQVLPVVTKNGAESRGEGLVFGAGLEWRWRTLVLGLIVQARATMMRFSGGALEEDASRVYWDAGLGLKAGLWLWRWSDFELGLGVWAFLWSQPRRVLLEGSQVFSQSYVEVFTGPTFHWNLP